LQITGAISQPNIQSFFSEVTAPWHKYGKIFNDLISQIEEEEGTQMNLVAVAKNKLDKEIASSEQVSYSRNM
jgi:hypothetical protein